MLLMASGQRGADTAPAMQCAKGAREGGGGFTWHQASNNL